MKNNYLLPFLLLSILFLSCRKSPVDYPNERTCNLAANELFSATINNKAWNGCEYKATYFINRKLLSIVGIDKNSDYEVRFYISLDTLAPLKSYTIRPNGNSGSEIIETLKTDSSRGADIYYCDLPLTNVGGTITISKLDTVAQKMSAAFNTTGYSLNQKKAIIVTNGILDNIKLDTSHAKKDDSYVSADINNNNWYVKDFFKQITLTVGGPQYQFLELKIPGYYIDNYFFIGSFAHFEADGRGLSFQIPLTLGTGTFQLYPQKAPYFNQAPGFEKHVFSYNVHNYDAKYFPVSGTITVTKVDMVRRDLDATFSTQTQNSSGDIINFTNGKIHIVNWVPML